MNLQKNVTITRQKYKQSMEGKDSLWTLESLMITSSMESPSVSTVTNIGI